MDFIWTLLKEAAMVVVKALAGDWAQNIITRIKGKTAPTGTRNGSDTSNN
jgi:hypothetical protein